MWIPYLTHHNNMNTSFIVLSAYIEITQEVMNE